MDLNKRVSKQVSAGVLAGAVVVTLVLFVLMKIQSAATALMIAEIV